MALEISIKTLHLWLQGAVPLCAKDPNVQDEPVVYFSFCYL